MEVFIAVQIEQSYHDRLERFTKDSFSDIHSELGADMHITLHYVGQTLRVNELCERLSAVALAPFSLTFSDFGTFTRAQEDDVVWQGVSDPSNGLNKLRERIGQALVGLLKMDTRSYMPHITLGYSASAIDARAILAMDSPLKGEGFTVKSFALCCVLPKSEGCHFRTIARYRLSTDTARKTVRLLCINDLHAAIEQSSAGIGAAKLAAAVRNYVQKYPDTRVFFGGDNFFGDPISELYEGKPVLDLMQAVNACASVAGNHDFDFSITQFAKWQQVSGVPMLSANLHTLDGGPCELVKPSLPVTIDGIRIGIIGLSMQEPMHAPDRPSEWTKYQLTDAMEQAKSTYSCLLKEDPNAVIALTHFGLRETREGVLIGEEALKLPSAVPTLDGFFAAHYHRFLQLTIGCTAVAEGGGSGRGFAVLALTFDKNKRLLSTIPLTYDLLDRQDSLPPDIELESKIRAYKAAAMVQMGETVAIAARDIQHMEPNSRRISLFGTPLTKLATEVMQEATGRPIALLYAGRIGEGFSAGEISLYRFYQVFSFANTLVTARMYGAKLRRIIELGMRSLPDDGASPVAVGGLCVTIDPGRPIGKRVLAVCLPDGGPLKDDTLYDVVFEDYLAGDPLGLIFSDASELTYHDLTLRELMLKKIRKLSILRGELPTNITARMGD